ncbi:MAG: glycosyltransferase family 2 protein [Deltaproteobacteria bacterium]|nr:glycosyltransferase family 2 protein [Deltaproteobacteria bacterium]
MERHVPDISVVLPVFNEVDNLRDMYRETVKALEETGRSFEIIACDDGSTDGSMEILRELAAEDPRVKVVAFARNFGQTAALDAGFRTATGKVIVPMDADLQNDPADIPRLLKRLDEGFDVVSGWRLRRRDAFWTKTLPSRIANRLVSLVTGVKLHDYGCTLKVYRADILRDFRLYGEMHRLIPAYVKWAGGSVVEEPVNHRPRRAGRSKYTLTKSIRLILDLLTVRFLLSYSTKPLYFIGKYGLMACALGTLTLAWTIFKRLWWGLPLFTDPFFLISIFLFLTGFQFLLFGLLAEMSMRTYFEGQNKPPYLIKTTINLPESDGKAPPDPEA